MSYYFVEGRRGKTHLCISEEKPKTTESKQMCCGAQTRPRNITEYAGQEITCEHCKRYLDLTKLDKEE